MLTNNGFVADTPEAISAVQMITAKSALKLESKGIKVHRGPKLRKSWAIKLGLKPNAKYEEVIAELEQRIEAASKDPNARLKPL